MTWHAYKDYQVSTDAFNLTIWNDNDPANRVAVKKLEFRALHLGLRTPEYTLSTEDGNDVRGFLQACLDCAWDWGLRPKAFKDDTSELTATRAHLLDMRVIAFNSVKVGLPDG